MRGAETPHHQQMNVEEMYLLALSHPLSSHKVKSTPWSVIAPELSGCITSPLSGC